VFSIAKKENELIYILSLTKKKNGVILSDKLEIKNWDCLVQPPSKQDMNSAMFPNSTAIQLVRLVDWMDKFISDSKY
jgi:hypothetical protein